MFIRQDITDTSPTQVTLIPQRLPKLAVHCAASGRCLTTDAQVELGEPQWAASGFALRFFKSNWFNKVAYRVVYAWSAHHQRIEPVIGSSRKLPSATRIFKPPMWAKR
ncbi:hypothetical protein GCM10009425_25790 [Pseudomonas asuensis]|uniref:Uncharacterized protein n=1 Tax=Pseudomonas asuensis TaxID=1825787 RepID=A0ABQ2GVF7_9PSED|nr:hypothetical protein [Pseudomonas asuensis]GGM13597.1 hypothetical protein GCM10009425_25790 [Pseudomonas asuensis]